MTDPVVEALVTTPPKVQLTVRQKVFRAASVGFGIVATVALVLSLIAMFGIARVANCTNTNLGTRSVPTQRDAAAHIAYANAQATYDKVEKTWHASVSAVLAAPKAQQAGLYAKFLTVDAQLDKAADVKEAANLAYKAQLSADQAQRNRNPLGKC